MKKVILFTATWCKNCEPVKAILEGLKSEMDIEKIDIDENAQLVQRFNIRSVPTVVYVNSHEVETQRILGLQPKQTYLSAWSETK